MSDKKQKRPRPFIDSSALFAGLRSKSGGARAILQLGQSSYVEILLSSHVLHEVEEVVRAKNPDAMAELLQLLDVSQVRITETASGSQLKKAKVWVAYEPDARVIADAITASPDFFVTLDKKHFLSNKVLIENLPFPVGTPGDFLSWYREQLADEA